MKKLILSLLLFIPIFAGAESITIQEFGGMVDVVEPDMLADKFSPDLLNVYTDEYNSLTKRRGYSPYLSTPLTQLQSIRTLYEYGQQSGDKYLIVESSSSIYYSAGDGNATSITNGRNPSYRYTFMTAKDSLYGSNGYDNPFVSTTTTYTELTVANSTGMVKARFIAYWNNRAWYAGIDNQRSTIWYSEYNDPPNIQPTNFKNINVSDGDNITAIQKTSDNKLKIYKTYSMWEMYEVSGGVFDFRNLSQKIGALYQTAVDEFNGQPVFISARGVELYDGSFNLITLPIDNFIKTLNQLKVGLLSVTQDTASDWGAGSGTNIDTTTYSGSVAMDNSGRVIVSSASVYYKTAQSEYGAYTGTIMGWRQKIIPATDIYACQLDTKWQIVSGDVGFVDISIANNSMTNIVSSVSVSISYTGNYSTTFPPTLLTANATYYIVLYNTDSSLNDSGPGVYVLIPDKTDGLYGSYYSGSWTDSIYGDLYYKLYHTTPTVTASFTSQSKEATSWGSWGTFVADQTVPANSDIDFFMVTATSSYNLGTNTYFSVTNNAPINNTVGPFAKVVSSFTRTDATAIPKLNKFTLNYYTAGANPPVLKVYDGRIWVFVSTNTTTAINDVVMVYQKTGDQTIFSNIYGGAACIYRDNFYTGSSQNTGKVYRQDVPDLYTDDGAAYPSYWCSKVFDCGTFASRKNFSQMWASAKNSGDWNLDISYRLDGTDDEWTSKTLNLTNGYGYIVSKIPFAQSEPHIGRYIQFKIGNSDANEHFRMKKLTTVFTIEPPL